MFSKAPVKRFNDEVGCAPPPSKYEPKNSYGSTAFSIPKSSRFVKPNFVPPAPNQYQESLLPSTPSRRTPASAIKRKDLGRRQHLSQLSQPSFDSSQRSGGGGSASVQQLQLKVAELRTRNAELLGTIEQLTASLVTQPVGTDGVILSAIDSALTSPTDTVQSAAGTVQSLSTQLTESSSSTDTVQSAAGTVQSLSTQLTESSSSTDTVQSARDPTESPRTDSAQSTDSDPALFAEADATQSAEAEPAQSSAADSAQSTAAYAAQSAEAESWVPTCHCQLVTGRVEALSVEEDRLRRSLLTVCEDLQQLDSRAARLERTQLQVDDEAAQRCRLEQQVLELLSRAGAQALRIKELELLVQVARESELEAHEHLCRLSDRVETLQTEVAVGGRQRADLQAACDQLLYQLADAADDGRRQRDEAERVQTQLRSRCSQLDSQLAAAAGRLQEDEAEADRLRGVLSEAHVDLEQQQLERREVELQLAALDGSLAALGQERDELAAARDQLQQQLEEQQRRDQAQLDQLFHHKAELQGQLDRLQAEAECVATAAADVGCERDNVRAQLSVEAERSESLRSDLWYAGLLGRLTELHTTELADSLADREAAVAQLEVRADQLRAEVGDADDRLQLARADVQAERRQAAQLECHKLELGLTAAQRQAELDEARVELAAATRAAAQRESLLQTRLTETEERCRVAQTQAEKTRTELEDTQRHLHARCDEVTGLKTAVCEAEDGAVVLESRLEALGDEARRRADKLQLLEQGAVDRNSQLEAMERQGEERDSELVALTVVLAEKTEGLRELCAARSQQEVELAELGQQQLAQQTALAEAERRLEAAEAHAAERQRWSDELTVELTRQRHQLAQLQASLTERDDELVLARRQQTDLRQQNSDLVRACDEYRERAAADELATTDAAELRAEVERLRGLHADAQAVVDSARQNMDEMKALYEEIIEEKDENVAELRERARQADGAEARVAELTVGLERAESAHQQVIAQCDTLSNEVKLTNSSMEYLELERRKDAAVADGLRRRAADAEVAAAETERRAAEALEDARVARLLVAEEQRHGARQAAAADEWRAAAAAAEADRARADVAVEAEKRAESAARQMEARLAELEASHERDLQQLYESFSEMRQRLQCAAHQEAANRQALQEAEAAARQHVDQLQKAETSLQSQTERLQQAEATAQRRAEQLQIAEARVKAQTEQNEWKDKYDKLFALVEPFQSQLELYRAEQTCLLEQTEGTRAELERLAAQYSQLLGHHNKKQKIHHIMQLKEQNLALKNELAMAEKKLKRQRVVQRQLEDRLRGDQNSTLLNATVSSKSKNRASYDLSKTVANPQQIRDGLSLLCVTPLKENSTNRSMGSPMAASSSFKFGDVKSARGLLKLN